MRRIALLSLLLLAFPAGADDPATGWRKPHEPPDDSWKQARQELTFNNLSEPETLDPALMTGNPEHTLAVALYEGLTSNDPETLAPRPGAAESWEVGEGGTLYTFRLRPKAKWSNGEPIVAEDFLWSWYRALTNELCDYAYLFYYIEGAEDFHREFAKAQAAPPYAKFLEQVRASAPDPHTIRVKLRAPTAYFLDLCAYGPYMPVHRATLEKHGDAWTRAGNWVGSGPFRLVEWNPRQHIVMEPNSHYWDAAFVKLRKITALPIDDMDVAYNKFLKGEAHWVRSVPTTKIDDAKRRPEYFVSPYLTTYFYRVNVTKPHLKDKRIRQALSLAINRETITRDVLRAGQMPATWLCPEMAHYKPPKGLPYDPDRARALLAEAGYPGGKDYPKLTLFYNTHEDHKRVAEQIAQMWRETLGIQVSLQNAEWKVYLRQVELLDYDIARAGWIGDYADPMTFLDMWVTEGGNNNTGWTSPKYDELIKQATYGDPAKRTETLLEAERMIVEDEFPILPIYIYVNQGMKVDGLRGWYENVRDVHPFQYLYFEPE